MLKCIGSGVLDCLKEKATKAIEFAKEHPFLAAVAAVGKIAGGAFFGAALSAFAAEELIFLSVPGLIQTGIGAIGVGVGLSIAIPAFKEVKGRYQDYEEANTDLEALKALHGVGSSSVDVAEGTFIALMGAKTVTDGLATMACDSELAYLSKFKPKEVAEAQNSLL